ncbi:MAG: 1-phosphofructokinase family hexose kinase, partial [Anaerolineae bacterium]|nr:1-phosphofructokinase family hexose kinase [Anaerolineae bacterium]
MILCVTPNAAIDRTLILTSVTLGEVHRPHDMIAAAGGKGINVARAIKVLGGDPLCAGIIAGHTGQMIADLAEKDDLPSHWTQLASGESRMCVILVDQSRGQSTVVNEAGINITADDWSQFAADVQADATNASLMAFCGSLPAGSSPQSFAELLSTLSGTGSRVWVDTSGKWLQAAAGLPGVSVKINDEELAQLVGHEAADPDQIADSAVEIWQKSRAPVVVTMGSKGAIFVEDADNRWWAQSPSIEVFNAVGSGDSFLAGLLNAIEKGAGSPDALRNAVAAGSANAMSKGGAHFS